MSPKNMTKTQTSLSVIHIYIYIFMISQHAECVHHTRTRRQSSAHMINSRRPAVIDRSFSTRHRYISRSAVCATWIKL